MSPIRVLHLARVVNRYDFIDTIVRYLPRDQFFTEVATFQAYPNIQSPAYEQIGIPHHVIPVPSMRAYPAYLKAATKLARLLKKRNIHILHTHHYWEGLVGALAKRLYPATKLIIHRHYTEDITRLKGWKAKTLLYFEQFSYQFADTIVVPTRTIHNFVISLHKSIKLPKIVDIPYGFEFEAEKYQPLSEQERLDFRRIHGVAEDTCIVTNVGSHRLQKGQVELIQAFAKLVREGARAVLWLVGDGPDGIHLRKIAEPLGDKVRFWGWQPPEMVRLLMGTSDIIAHPSYSEAFPQVMIEALALERALVISQVSGAVETLTHTETAWLIPVGDTTELYKALKTLIANPELRTSLGSAGRRHILAKLHYSVINRSYLHLYSELCSQSVS